MFDWQFLSIRPVAFKEVFVAENSLRNRSKIFPNLPEASPEKNGIPVDLLCKKHTEIDQTWELEEPSMKAKENIRNN